ncbi:MAG: PhoPQ-activated pathogenicity-related family protein [Coxiellaceae bacterium]|jgi:PhoPQ-activated pathogenicity-related protein|nr:PhoPQ-activated pathogenicity-related family protein [Coxiellaceae bacterium]
MREVLECFLKYDDGIYKYKFIGETSDSPDITRKIYVFDSQKWPLATYSDIPSIAWQHRFIFYIPKQIVYPKVLLYVNGGRTRNIKGEKEWLSSREQIDYTSIALTNKAVVVELQDVPNQFLFFNNKPYQACRYAHYRF